jgi:hypothetical protein
MVGHQYKSMQLHVIALQYRLQAIYVKTKIIITEKAGLAVITALHDVARNTFEIKPGFSAICTIRCYYFATSVDYSEFISSAPFFEYRQATAFY